MSAREAFSKLVEDAREAWQDHTITFNEGMKLLNDLSEAATTIKDPDAKPYFLESFRAGLQLLADGYDIPRVPGPIETRIEGYLIERAVEGAAAWYDAAVGPPHAA